MITQNDLVRTITFMSVKTKFAQDCVLTFDLRISHDIKGINDIVWKKRIKVHREFENCVIGYCYRKITSNPTHSLTYKWAYISNSIFTKIQILDFVVRKRDITSGT